MPNGTAGVDGTEFVVAVDATDPNAPPPDQLSFATYGDPVAPHAFGAGFETLKTKQRIEPDKPPA
mgnify:CR=1 FL=1